MPFLRRPMLLRESPSAVKKGARIIILVVLTTTIFVFGLAAVVVMVTD